MCVRFSGCPKSVVTAASELLIIHPFLCRNKFCYFFFEFTKYSNPKLCYYVHLLWWICEFPTGTCMLYCGIRSSSSASLYVSVDALELECLSHIHSLLYALLINYVTTISRLEELFFLPFVLGSLACSLLELNSEDIMLYKWRKFSPNCEEKM